MTRYQQLDRARIAQMADRGYTVDEIVEAIDAKSKSHVLKILTEMGFREATKGIKRLDIPKVKALQKAGWPMAKIVDEFGYNFTAEQIDMAVKCDRIERRHI